MALRWRALRHPGGNGTESERRAVGQHVAGIGEKGERPGPPAAERLDKREGDGQGRGRAQRISRRGVMMRVVVVVVVMMLSHAASPVPRAPPRRSSRARP